MKPTIDSAGPLAVLDGVFPPGWDHATDVLVVVGRSDPAFFRALIELGQQRVIEVAAKHSPDPLPPEPFVRTSSALEMFHAVLRFQGDPSGQASIRRQPGSSISDRELGELVQALRGAISSSTIYRRSTEVLAPQWARHGIANLPRIARNPSVFSLRDAFRGVPCVIVSPGPSLERNAHLLPALRGRALVMTCSHALRAIEEAGARPDVITVSDPKFTGRHFDGCTSMSSAALFLDAVVDPRNFELPARRIFSFVTHPSVDSWILGPLGESELFHTGGSVACAEFSIAEYLGCDPIVLVGQDLALTGGRYYAKTSIDGMAYIEPNEDGSTFELVRPHLLGEEEKLTVTRHPEEGMLEVPAWGGGSVHTSDSLFTFLQWFRAAAHSTDRRLLNCTEGGAFIDGMEHVGLEQVLDGLELEPVDVAGILEERVLRIDFEARVDRMRGMLEEMIAGLGRCAAESRRCIELATRALRDPSALEELELAEQRLASEIAPIPVLSMFAQVRIREAQARAQGAKTLDENLAAAKQLFRVVQEAVRKLEGPMKVALADLDA